MAYGRYLDLSLYTPATPVKSSLSVLLLLILLAHRLHGGEEQHVADGGGVGQQHSAFGAGWWTFVPDLTLMMVPGFKFSLYQHP